MSAICGAVGKKASIKVYEMLNSMRHRGEDLFFLYQSGEISRSPKIEDLDVNEGSNFSLGHSKLLISEKKNEISIEDKYIFIDGQIYDSDMKNKLPDKVLNLDGEFSLALFNEDEIILGRDYVGSKPLYYLHDDNDTDFVFASEKKALIKLGFSDKKIKTLEPYTLLKFDGNLRINSLDRKRPEEANFDVNTLIEKLVFAIEKRLMDVKKTGILFSGGIDSTLLASLCEKDLVCITVGFRDSYDIREAKKIASLLDIDLVVQEFTIEEVKRSLREVCYAIEDISVLNLGVGLPVYLATKIAKELGLKVVLAGQGADELFGGYHKYLAHKESLNDILWEEFLNISKNNLERDDKASMANSISLRLPYLDNEVVEYAFKIPSTQKIKNGERKYPLKEAAKKMKLPKEVYKKEKKAIQYGTGLHKLLKKISRESGLTINEFVSKLKSEVFL